MSNKKKKISCGALLFWDGKLLICRPRWDSDLWNLPKGMQNDGETPLETMIREVKEETNILVDKDKDAIVDLGRTKYLRKKDIHLFFVVLHDKPVDIKCNSFFQVHDKEFPEMVDFKWISMQDMNPYFSDKLNKSISILIGDKKDGDKR